MAQGWGPQPPHGYPPGQGYPPQQGYPQQGYPPQQVIYVQQKPKKGFFAGCGTLLLIAIGVGTCFAISSGSKSAKKAADEDWSKQSATAVQAAELVKAYKENEIAADQKYKGKKLEVSGTVEAIDSDIGDEPVIRLGGALFENVHAHGLSKDVAANLKKGEKVTLVCRGNGEVIGSPQLDKCTMK